MLHHGAPETVVQNVIFNRADYFHAAGEEFERAGVERLDPAWIDERDGDALFFELLRRFFSDFEHVAEAEDRDVTSMLDDFSLPDLEELGFSFWFCARAGTARITNGDRSGVVIRHCPKHVGEFVFVLWLHMDPIRDMTQITDIEQAMVGRAIVATQTGAIHAQTNVEFLNRHVVNRHVVSALEERGVDRQKRFQALRGESTSEERGMFFGDSDIEIPIGMSFGEMSEAGAAWHRRRDRNNLSIRVRKFRKRLAYDFRIGWRGCRRGLAALDLVFAEAVKFVRLFDRRLVAFAFLRQNVQQDGFILRLEKFECADEQGNIVSVDRSVIAKAEFFEDYARHEQAFDAFFDLVGEFSDRLSSDRFDEAPRFVVQMRESGARGDVVQVGRDRADVFGDRPLVVV